MKKLFFLMAINIVGLTTNAQVLKEDIINTVKININKNIFRTAINESILPNYLRDRGTGIPTSFFGTYVKKNELVIYPIFEYYLQNKKEYKPSEFGFNSSVDYTGKYRASEGLLFMCYGITDWLTIEMEAAVIKATQHKSSNDVSKMPSQLSESGLGDVQNQINIRLLKETKNRPELYNYFEVGYPFQKNKLLIGTKSWEFKFGGGLIRGFNFGTLTVRASAEYTLAEKKLILSTYAFEYLKKISDRWKIYGGVEGKQDEVELVTEFQLYVSRNSYIKINNSFGLTSKTTDWAPEIGILISTF